MKIIQYLLFLLLIAIIAGSIYIATKNGDYRIEESRIIPAPTSLVFNEVNDLSNWEAWSPWSQNENVSLSFSEQTAGEGANFSWENAEIRDGSVTTVEVIPYSRIAQNLNLDLSVGQTNGNMNWNFETLEEGTRVTWSVEGTQSFKEKLGYMLQDDNLQDILKPRFTNGLENLEQEVVRQMEEYSINVDGVTTHGGGYYMYTTTATRINEVTTRAAEMIRQVTLYMEENNISISGRPFVLYNQRDVENNTTIFSAAVPTPSQVITPSGSPVLPGYLPRQRTVKATLRGNHKNALEAWEAAHSYINDNGLQVDPEGTPFEVYITNPAEELNPAEWVTEIYIPILEATPENSLQ